MRAYICVHLCVRDWRFILNSIKTITNVNSYFHSFVNHTYWNTTIYHVRVFHLWVNKHLVYKYVRPLGPISSLHQERLWPIVLFTFQKYIYNIKGKLCWFCLYYKFCCIIFCGYWYGISINIEYICSWV